MAERQEEIAAHESRAVIGSAQRTNPWPARVFTFLWWVWLAALALIACSRFFAALAWRVDLVANVSYFIALPAAVTAALALWRRRRALAGAALLVTLVAAWPVRYLFVPWGGASAAPTGGRYTLRVLEANVQGATGPLERLPELIARLKPDVVVVIETPPTFENRVAEDAAVAAELPFAIAPERGSQWRDMMLSRFPMRPLRFDGDDDRYQQIYAYKRSCFIDTPHGRFLLSAMHPASPRDPQSWARGNEWTSRLAEVCGQHLIKAGVPVVIAGDFNTTPAGYRHRIMLERSGLKPVDRLGEWTGTWPSDWPGAVRLSIDRVWVSPDVQFVSREVLEDIGSDHRPMLVTLSLPAERGASEGRGASDGR